MALGVGLDRLLMFRDMPWPVFRDVPWLVFGAVMGPGDLTVEGIMAFMLDGLDKGSVARQVQLHAARLWWHPDKFEGQVDAGAGAGGCGGCCLNELGAGMGMGMGGWTWDCAHCQGAAASGMKRAAAGST